MAKASQASPLKRTSARRAKPADEVRQANHEEIAQRARELYEEAGRPVGRDEEFWLEAERQLRELLRA